MAKERIYPKGGVKTGAYAVVDLSSNVLLVTYNLGKEVCFSVYSAAWGKAALARSLDNDTIQLMMQEFTANALPVGASNLIQVKIMGGPTAKDTDLIEVTKRLQASEKEHYQFDIIGAKRGAYHSLEFEPSNNRLEPHRTITYGNSEPSMRF